MSELPEVGRRRAATTGGRWAAFGFWRAAGVGRWEGGWAGRNGRAAAGYSRTKLVNIFVWSQKNKSNFVSRMRRGCRHLNNYEFVKLRDGSWCFSCICTMNSDRVLSRPREIGADPRPFLPQSKQSRSTNTTNQRYRH